MSLAVKQRLVHGALLVLALWPLAHLALVRAYDLSPWKLAGWGMYTTPRFGLLGMEVYGRARPDDAWQQLVAPSPATRDAATAFLERHRWLRRLASSDALVAAVRAQQPAWREVRIVVSYPVLDRTTSRVRLVTDERVVAVPPSGD
jgi:hypothetical protein